MHLICTNCSEHRRIRLVNSPSFKNIKVKLCSNQQTLLHNSTTNTPQHTYTLLLSIHRPTSFLTQIYSPPSRPISSPTLPSTPLLPVDLIYSTRKQLSNHLPYIINRTPLYQNGIKKYRASLLLPPSLNVRYWNQHLPALSEVPGTLYLEVGKHPSALSLSLYTSLPRSISWVLTPPHAQVNTA